MWWEKPSKVWSMNQNHHIHLQLDIMNERKQTWLFISVLLQFHWCFSCHVYSSYPSITIKNTLTSYKLGQNFLSVGLKPYKLYRLNSAAVWLSAKAANRTHTLVSHSKIYHPSGWRLDLFLYNESVFWRTTVHMHSSGIRMCFSQDISTVMTKKTSGITKCTCHRNWLKYSQIVKPRGSTPVFKG